MAGSITLVPGPEFAMRYNQSLYPVPEEFKTSGQYYEDYLEELIQISMIAVLKAELRQQRLRDCMNFATTFATSDSLPQELSRSTTSATAQP